MTTDTSPQLRTITTLPPMAATLTPTHVDVVKPRPSFSGLRPAERSLVKGLLAGDPEAYELLDREYRDRIYRFALKRLRDAAEADDVCQDVFLDLHRSISSFEGRSSLLTWIFGIAHHQVHRRFRRRDRDALPLEESTIERIAPQASRVEERIDAARALDTLGEALEETIAPRHRDIFHLRYQQGFATGAIAKRLGRSTQSVKISLFRTRRALAAAVPDVAEVLSAT